MKKILCLVLMLILITGCSSKEKINVKFTCNGIEKEMNVGVGSKFKCDLFGKHYELKVTELKDNSFVVSSNNPLSEVIDRNIDSNSTITKFEIAKGKTTELAVPLDGLSYKISFNY